MQSIQKGESCWMGWVWIDVLIIDWNPPSPDPWSAFQCVSRVGLGFLFSMKANLLYQLGWWKRWVWFRFGGSKTKNNEGSGPSNAFWLPLSPSKKKWLPMASRGARLQKKGASSQGVPFLNRRSFCKGQTIKGPSTKQSLTFSPAPRLSPQVTKEAPN